MPDPTRDLASMTDGQIREAAFIVLLQEQVKQLAEQSKDDRAQRATEARERQQREDRRDEEQRKRDDALFDAVKGIEQTVRASLKEIEEKAAATFVRQETYTIRHDALTKRVADLEGEQDAKRAQVKQLGYGLVAAVLTAIIVPLVLLLLNVPGAS